MAQLHRRGGLTRIGAALALLIVATMLSACGAILETDLTIYADERYATTMTITAPAETIAMVGGPAAMKSQLDQWAAEAKAQGAQAKWYQGKAKQAGNTVYVLEMSGKGFQSKLIQDTFRLTWVDYQGRKAVRFEMSPQSLSSGMGMGTITLHAVEILSSNGKKIGNDSFRWDNPISGIQATVMPKGQTSALLIVAILIVLLVLAAGGYFAYRRGYLRTSSSAIPAPVPSGGFCPHCGQPTQAGARFCMNCGKEIPLR